MAKNFPHLISAPTVKPYSMQQTIQDYYAGHSFTMPQDDASLGHFDVFRLEEYIANGTAAVPFGRKEYLKVCIIAGNSIIHYADKSVHVKNRALFFGNSMIPYSWQWVGENQTGYSCIFDEAFFIDYGRIREYPVFQPGNDSIFELTADEFSFFSHIFNQMIAEKNDTFTFKKDVLRGLIFQIIHRALKMRPSPPMVPKHAAAALRTTELFLELLETQFPLKLGKPIEPLRSPTQYASQLAIHVNHLNKSVKEVLNKTTTDVIQERLLKEAKLLLKHSNHSISEIAYALGFGSPTHFGAFFKRYMYSSPGKFRHHGG